MTNLCTCGTPVADAFSVDLNSTELQGLLWDTRTSEAVRSCNSGRPLTHPLDLGEEGLAMQATQCSIDGCGKPAKARSWCGMHWWRWRNHGDANWTPPSPSAECSVEDCDAEPMTRGMCVKHYARLKRTGITELRDLNETLEQATERFWAKVDKSAGPTGCWPWLGTVTNAGYGQFRYLRRWGAHRFAYESAKGPIPNGLTIDHVKAWGCARTDCCNPAHLEAVTMAENLRRSEAASAVNSRKTECLRCGSAYDSDADGHRFCGPCRRAWKPRGAS